MTNLFLSPIWMNVLVLTLLIMVIVFLILYVRKSKSKDKLFRKTSKLLLMASLAIAKNKLTSNRLTANSTIPGEKFDLKGFYLVSDDVAMGLHLKDHSWFKAETIKKEMNKKVYWFIPIGLLNPILIKHSEATRRAKEETNKVNKGTDSSNTTPNKEEDVK